MEINVDYNVHFRWMQPIEGEPGINKQMIMALKEKVDRDPETYSNVTMMLDAMAIRKQVS